MNAPRQDAEQLRERRAEVERLTNALTTWARYQPTIRALGIVGSWARDVVTCESDLDVLLLTAQPGLYLDSDNWLTELGSPPIVRRSRFGRITERRVRMPTGLEVEFGIGPVSWANTAPIDDGTRQVASDGLLSLHDPDSLLADLMAAI